MNAEIGQKFEPTVGALLNASRLRCGEDLREVASVLKIRYAYLQAIEEGRYEDLPGLTYAVGFVRTYAEHLGLDADEVVRRFKNESENLERRTELVFPSPIAERGTPGAAIVFIGVLVAALAYGAWYVGTSEDSVFEDLVTPLPDRLAALLPGDHGQPPQGQTGPSSAEAAPQAASGSSESGLPAGTSIQPPAEASDTQPEGAVPEAQAEQQVSMAPAIPVTEVSPPPEIVPPQTATVTPPPTAKPAMPADRPAVAATPPVPAAASQPPVVSTAAPAVAPITPPVAATPTPPSVAASPTPPPVVAAAKPPVTPTPPAAPAPAPATPAAPTPAPAVTAATPAPAPAAPTAETRGQDQEAQRVPAAAPAPAAQAPAVPPATPKPATPTPPPASTQAAASQPIPAAPPAAPPTPAPAPAPEAAAPAKPVAEAPPQSVTPAPEQVAAVPAAPAVPPVAEQQPVPADSGNSRIEVRALSDSWIQIRDGVARRLLVTRLLRAGDVYRVPDQPGLTLLTGNAGALEILVDGDAVAPIGEEGAVRRNVTLDAERLLAGTAVVD